MTKNNGQIIIVLKRERYEFLLTSAPLTLLDMVNGIDGIEMADSGKRYFISSDIVKEKCLTSFNKLENPPEFFMEELR